MKREIDDYTKRAQALLYFKHFDRISAIICDAGGDDMDIDAEVIHAETIIALQLEDDDEYKGEMEEIGAKYGDASNRPEGKHPDVWHRERRQMELRAGFKSACREGVLSHKGLEFVEDPL